MENKLTFCEWLKKLDQDKYINFEKRVNASISKFILPTWTQDELDNMRKFNA